MGEIWTIGRVLQWTKGHFADKGVRTPALDAELIVAHALGLNRVALYTRSDQPLVPDERERIKELIARRLAGEPVAYITGVKEFWGMQFRVNPHVLVPRPETEEIIEEARRMLQSRRNESLRFMDIGTGCGCLAAALCAEFKAASGLATDISQSAIEVARGNIEALGFSARVEFRVGDLFGALMENDGTFDLIVSNPPYVPIGEIETLAPEVKCETRIALEGGVDGLDIARKIIAEAARYLTPNGRLLMEIGSGQSDDISGIETGEGFVFSGFRPDLAGILRVAKWRKAGGL